jgi:hypothetical protein
VTADRTTRPLDDPQHVHRGDRYARYYWQLAGWPQDLGYRMALKLDVTYRVGTGYRAVLYHAWINDQGVERDDARSTRPPVVIAERGPVYRLDHGTFDRFVKSARRSVAKRSTRAGLGAVVESS